MALVRCKSCGIDTSDSLERCPHCGGSPTVPSLASAVAAAAEAANRVADARATPDAAVHALEKLFLGLRNVPRIVWIVGLLVVLATVPHALPILVALTILWMLGRGRHASRTEDRSAGNEARRIFVGRSSSIQRAAAERPLELLRAVERRTLERDA